MPMVKCAYCSTKKYSGQMYYCSYDDMWICSTHVESGPRCPRCRRKLASRTSSGCFLTTACVEHAGLPDDCPELKAMRALRDGHLRHLPRGKAMIDEYYRIAPIIVARLRLCPEREEILDMLLAKIRRATRLMERDRHNEALTMCWREFKRLSQKFVQ